MSAVAEASPSIRARDNLSALGLHEMAASLPDYVRMVSAGERDFCSALEEMTRVEVAARESRIVRQRIRSSGFPYVKGLADFDWDFQPSVPRARVEELATLRFIERAENVLLVGSPGVGKTHLAVAIGIEAVRAGREVRFMDCARLVEDLADAQARGILKKRLKYYAHSKLLVIDELGYLDIGEGGADLLFQLISTRYEQRSTIITTNVGIGGWGKVFGDDVARGGERDRGPRVPPLPRHQDHRQVLPAEGPATREEGGGVAGSGGSPLAKLAKVRLRDRRRFFCAIGEKYVDGISRKRSELGFESVARLYTCGDCGGCPRRGDCMRSKDPEARRQVAVNPRLAEYRRRASALLHTERGSALRKRRGVDVETAFGDIKRNLGFTRFTLRGLEKVELEWRLVATGHNIRKMFLARTGAEAGA